MAARRARQPDGGAHRRPRVRGCTASTSTTSLSRQRSAILTANLKSSFLQIMKLRVGNEHFMLFVCEIELRPFRGTFGARTYRISHRECCASKTGPPETWQLSVVPHAGPIRVVPSSR